MTKIVDAKRLSILLPIPTYKVINRKITIKPYKYNQIKKENYENIWYISLIFPCKYAAAVYLYNK